ncbi:MAG TPA: hypothetical protein VMM56_14700 [Planctomycetaceae bacterium]|nr:hypothetical protein [Planctomycetaceae bacterium]
MLHTKMLSMFCLLGLFVMLSGCDTAPQTSSEIIQADPLLSALSKVGQLYHNYHDVHGQGPANWDELKTMAGDKQEMLDAIQYVRDKGYDLKWGVKFSSLTEGLSSTVMGQSSQESAKVFFDGAVSK